MNLHGSIQLRVNLRTIKGEWFSQCGQESTRLCPSLSKHSVLSVPNWANCPWHTFSLHLNSILSLRHHPSNHKAVPRVSHDLCNGVRTACCLTTATKYQGLKGRGSLLVRGVRRSVWSLRQLLALRLRSGSRDAMNAGAELTCSFFPFDSVWDPTRWDVPPTYRVSRPLSNCVPVSVINTTAKNNCRKKGLVLNIVSEQ